jgi:hypothetical protein
VSEVCAYDCRPANPVAVALRAGQRIVGPPLLCLGRSGLLKSPLQSSARPILENYGCRWNETWIKVLYEAAPPPEVIELIIQVSSRIFDTQQKLSKIP